MPWLTHAAGLFLPRFLSPSPAYRRACRALGSAHEDGPYPLAIISNMLVNVTPITHTPDQIVDAAVSIRSKLIRFRRNNDIEYFRFHKTRHKDNIFIVLPLFPSRCTPLVQWLWSTTFLTHWKKTIQIMLKRLELLWLIFKFVSRRSPVASPKQLKPTRDATASAAAERKPEVQIFKNKRP